MPDPQATEPLHPDSDYAQIVSALRSGDRGLVDAAEEGFKSQPPEVLAEFNGYIQRQARSGDPNGAMRSRATGGGELFGIEGMKLGVEDVLHAVLGAGSALAKNGVGAVARLSGSFGAGEITAWGLRRLGVPAWASDAVGMAVGYGTYKAKIPGSVRVGRGTPNAAAARVPVNPSAASNTGTATAPTTTTGFGGAHTTDTTTGAGGHGLRGAGPSREF